MASVINTNIASLNAQRNLSNSQSALNTSIQRLSTGLRINSAKDDAAGLAISERFSTQINGLNQAVRNANDGISLAQTAEGALSTISNNLQRIRTLAVQSRNATNSPSDREALQKEVSQLSAEIDRVAKDTSFNGTFLLNGNFQNQSFQVGANAGQRITIGSIADARIENLGEVHSRTFSGALAALTVDNNGAAEVGDPDDPVGPPAYVAATGSSFDELDAGAFTITITDANDNVTTLESGVISEATGRPVAGSVDLTTSTSEAQAARLSQIRDEINRLTEGRVTASLNDAGTDLILNSGESFSITLNAANGGAQTSTGLTDQTSIASKGFDDLNVNTAENADMMIHAMDAALKSVNEARADLGAIQNRFTSVVSNLQVTAENLSASRSRILDTDFAEETANLTRGQILQQAGTAMLAQANSLPNTVLTLLQG